MTRSPALVRAGSAVGVRATRRSPGKLSFGTPTANDEPSSAMRLTSSQLEPSVVLVGASCLPKTVPSLTRVLALSSAPPAVFRPGAPTLRGGHGPGVGRKRLPGHQRAGVCLHVLRGKAELPEDHVARRRGAEVVEPDRDALLADPALPAEGRQALDAQPGGDRRRQHLVPV